MNQICTAFTLLILLATSCTTSNQIRLAPIDKESDLQKKIFNVAQQISNTAYEGSDTASLKLLIDEISKPNDNQNLWLPTLRNLHFKVNIYPDSTFDVNKLIKYLNPLRSIDKYEIDFYDVIRANQEVLSLMTDGIIKYNTQSNKFSTRTSSSIFDVIFYSNITKDQTIAEIGSGLSTLAIFAGALYPDNEIFCNEIDTSLLRYSSERIKFYKNFINKENYRFVKGDSLSTNIQTKVDLIILRRVLHHFDYPNEMLESIKNNLADKGNLLIYEARPRKWKKFKSCKRLMKKKAILQLLKENDFEIKKKRITKRKMYLIYGT